MTIHTETRGHVLIIRPGGNFNRMAANELQELLDASIAEGATRLVFDFSLLSHISSDGLRVILRAVSDIQAKNGKVVVTEMSDQVRGVFEASGFFDLIRNYNDLNSAVTAIFPNAA